MPEANAVRNLIGILNTSHEKYIHDSTLLYFLNNEWPLLGKAHVFEFPTALNAYERANHVLEKYYCRDKMPSSVCNFLSAADPKYLPPTEEELTQRPYYKYRVMGPDYMINAAMLRQSRLVSIPPFWLPV